MNYLLGLIGFAPGNTNGNMFRDQKGKYNFYENLNLLVSSDTVQMNCCLSVFFHYVFLFECHCWLTFEPRTVQGLRCD